MALERVHVRRPISAERRHPRVYLLQRLGTDAIDATLRIDGRLYEARFSKHAQVLRYRGLGKIERGLEIANVTLASGQENQNSAAARVGEDRTAYTSISIYVSSSKSTGMEIRKGSWWFLSSRTREALK
jgi:hypothetical protein